MALGHAWAARNALRIDAHFAAVPRFVAAPRGASFAQTTRPRVGPLFHSSSWHYLAVSALCVDDTCESNCVSGMHGWLVYRAFE